MLALGGSRAWRPPGASCRSKAGKSPSTARLHDVTCGTAGPGRLQVPFRAELLAPRFQMVDRPKEPENEEGCWPMLALSVTHRKGQRQRARHKMGSSGGKTHHDCCQCGWCLLAAWHRGALPRPAAQTPHHPTAEPHHNNKHNHGNCNLSNSCTETRSATAAKTTWGKKGNEQSP